MGSCRSLFPKSEEKVCAYLPYKRFSDRRAVIAIPQLSHQRTNAMITKLSRSRNDYY